MMESVDKQFLMNSKDFILCFLFAYLNINFHKDFIHNDNNFKSH